MTYRFLDVQAEYDSYRNVRPNLFLSNLKFMFTQIDTQKEIPIPLVTNEFSTNTMSLGYGQTLFVQMTKYLYISVRKRQISNYIYQFSKDKDLPTFQKKSKS